MAREWRELFIVSDSSRPEAAAAEAEPQRRAGRLRRLRESLRRTRQALQSELATTARVVEQLEREASEQRLRGGQELTERLISLLTEIAQTGDATIDLRPHPTVILVAGVNGTGKTTTLGKLAWHLSRELGRRVVLAAGDTFRAAAVEQLQEWARRAEVDFVKGSLGADSASVAYEAIEVARRQGADVVLIDTAGRLHTQDNLMAELAKVRRVIAKQIPEAPHETLLTVDATTGQNGLRQAQAFSEAIDVSGLVLTKLDGTAKGGIALAIAAELGIPVKLIGI